MAPPATGVEGYPTREAQMRLYEDCTCRLVLGSMGQSVVQPCEDCCSLQSRVLDWLCYAVQLDISQSRNERRRLGENVHPIDPPSPPKCLLPMPTTAEVFELLSTLETRYRQPDLVGAEISLPWLDLHRSTLSVAVAYGDLTLRLRAARCREVG